MDPIDNRDRPTRLLPNTAAAANTGAPVIDIARVKLTATAPTKRIPKKSAQTAPQDLLEQRLRSKIKQLMQQPTPPQTVAQSVIGTLLTWEFNDALHFEPKFNALLQRVQQHIENEPMLNTALQKIIEQLSQ